MNKRVKICVVTTIPFTLKVFLLEQLVFLSQHGYEVTVVCDYDAEFRKECPKEIEYYPINLKRNLGILSTFMALFQLYLFFKKNTFDIVQYCTPKAAFIAAIASTLVKTPVRLYCQWGIRYVGYNGPFRSFLKCLEKLTCYFSTDIAPDSKGNLDFSIKEGLYSSKKASVVHNGSANGVDIKKYDSTQKDTWGKKTRYELGINEDGFIFGFVGRVTRDKGINELVKAYIQLAENDPNVHLLLVGPLEKKTLLPETLNLLNTFPRIKCTGYQKHPEKFLAAMDVMVLPSYREGFGIVLIEAQAMGIPVITTRIPGPSEAVLEGITGLLISAADETSLCTAMKQIKGTPLMAKIMGEKGCQFVKERFEQTIFWEKVLDHRNSLINRVSNLS